MYCRWLTFWPVLGVGSCLQPIQFGRLAITLIYLTVYARLYLLVSLIYRCLYFPVLSLVFFIHVLRFSVRYLSQPILDMCVVKPELQIICNIWTEDSNLCHFLGTFSREQIGDMMSPNLRAGGDILILVRTPLASVSASAWHILVCTISCEPVVGFSPNFHGYNFVT